MEHDDIKKRVVGYLKRYVPVWFGEGDIMNLLTRKNPGLLRSDVERCLAALLEDGILEKKTHDNGGKSYRYNYRKK